MTSANADFPDYPFTPRRMELRPGISMSYLDEGGQPVVVAQRNPTYSAFALIVTLVSLAAIFGLLGLPFIAALQIVV